MSKSTGKRTLDAFFKPPVKRQRISATEHGGRNPELATASDQDLQFSRHPMYPFPIKCFPQHIETAMASFPSATPRVINDQPDLDLLYFEPYIPRNLEREIFQFLRSELPFYRVEYNIKRGGIENRIRTPRYTTVFGLDETARFNETGDVVNATTGQKLENEKYYSKYPPRPIPKCLDDIRTSTEAATGCKFNFCLVNYYASGSDSISYHSDNERFLGKLPAIASFSLGARRDFLMKHKPVAPNANAAETKTVKLPLAGGDMLLMRGKTQSNWLHSIPKRTGRNVNDGGRINITFRRATEKGGTENYYNYNVGTGPVYRWDGISREMKSCKP
ncbi:Clavaminate synthase-like protein [Venustampulla echinocandica]|uniref:Clavaminate synthase-like protein n=1 Tax=Venustampulla echinocandica TaxID=2656787 RepID=A0A370TSF8_9HELO|nr:Clavaminate synthase-like protein [Venustampulla echinocandica]RDL38467.1 Clavaminate synthase-like protein [Venustampulla echinocandica]